MGNIRSIILLAIENNVGLNVSYKDKDGKPSTRLLSNLELYQHESEEYLRGYCHLRQDERTFKLERIIGARLERDDLILQKDPFEDEEEEEYSATIAFEKKFKTIYELVDYMYDQSTKRGARIDWNNTLKSICDYRSYWSKGEIGYFVKACYQKLEFQEILDTHQFVHDKSLLKIIRNENIWNDRTLYKTLNIGGYGQEDFIREFEEFWNWDLLGRYVKHLSLETLTTYRDKWKFKDSIDNPEPEPPSFLQHDTVFDNPKIPWHETEYQEAFKAEIENYKRWYLTWPEKSKGWTEDEVLCPFRWRKVYGL